MRTTATTTDLRALHRSQHQLSPLRFVRDVRFVLVVLLSLLSGVLAYQAPPSGSVPIGWLGDRLFLSANSGLGDDTSFYSDDLTDSPTGRSRWTRQRALITLPSLGAGTALDLTLLAQGWPNDIVGRPPMQPNVQVLADGAPIGTFTPIPTSAGTWNTYRFRIPAVLRTNSNLTIELQSSATFTDTLRGSDPRPKGVRLARLGIAPVVELPSLALLPPAWPMTIQLLLTALLLYAVLLRFRVGETPAFVLATLGTGALGVALSFSRVWAAALLGGGFGGAAVHMPLVVVLAVSWREPLLRLVRGLVLRYGLGRALGYGLVSAALGWLGLVLAAWSLTFQLPGTGLFFEIFPDSLLYGMLGMGLLALALVRGREGLPRLANSLVDVLGGRRSAPMLLLLLGGIWLAYEISVVLNLPYVGHADYADNAVVARNLLAGRGWVVDYVTQFYTLSDSLTRPQETWPLLQPVWIALSFAMFGVHDWSAKVPNLVCNIALLVLVYRIGARVWDRRIGLTAALLVLTNYLFFRLTIYSTSDLAFVVFALGAMYALYVARGESGQKAEGRRQKAEGRQMQSRWLSRLLAFDLSPRSYLLLSGLLTGLMILQKPSSAIMAAGMGLWYVWDVRLTIYDLRFQTIVNRKSQIVNLALWALVAFVVVAPYMWRNVGLCHAAVCSTERYDAWVLGYRGDTDEAWGDIYRVFDPQLGGLGLPDRSWILRWGFDLTLDKFERQVAAVRDYLLPPWLGLSDGLSAVFARPDKQQLLWPMGAWLSLAGLLAALRARRRLVALLTLSFGPYIVFLATYWHTTEDRYFVPLLPWLALLAAWTVWAGYKRLATIGDGRWAPLGLALSLAALFCVTQPSWPDIANKVQDEPARWAPDLAAYQWLRDNTPPNTAVMTRTPWQLNWHTERPALMIPNTADRNQILQLARHYGVEYIAFETLQRVKGDAQNALATLITARDAQPGAVIDGFTLVYASPTPDNRVLIYRLPDK